MDSRGLPGHDATEYETRAQEPERRSKLLNSIPVILYSADLNYRATWVSDDLPLVTGYSIERMLEDPDFWRERIHPGDKEPLSQRLADAGQQPSITSEYRWRVSSGEYRWFQDSFTGLNRGPGQRSLSRCRLTMNDQPAEL